MTTIIYHIPNGTMCINAEEFFLVAGRRQIRNMLKQLKQDCQAAEKYTPLIREYLDQQTQEVGSRAAAVYAELVNAGTKHAEAQARYREMQNPCYACYTLDKKKLTAAKKAVAEAKRDYEFARSHLRDSTKLKQRYQDIQKYVDEILGN